MRLVFVFDGPIYYDANGNYYEYALHGLYERYSYMADEIVYLIRTFPLEKETKNTLVPSEIKIISVPDYKGIKKYLLQKNKAERIIANTIKNTDIVVLRGSSCAHIAEKYVRKYKKPYIYECVDCPWDGYWNHSLLGKMIAPIAFLRARKIIYRAPYVYYVTNRFLQKRYPTKGKSIGCSNVVLNIIDEKELETKIKRYGTLNKKSHIVFGTAAALDVRYKGQEYVIRAIKELTDMGYDIEYRLAGGNRLKSTFLFELAKQLKIEDKIINCGSLDSSEMGDFYKEIDIYFQPSKQEGLPRSVIEAMSYGCVCMGSRVAGIPELLQSNLVFKCGSVREMVHKFISLISNEDLIRISKRNYEVSKRYDINVLNERRNEFYNSFMKTYHLTKREKK